MTQYPELKGYKVQEVPVDVIYFDQEFNCRGVFTPQSCLELSESMRLNGLQMPIVLQPADDVPEIPSEYEYRIVAGHRRYTAAVYLLQWKNIPAMVVSGLTAQDAKMRNLIENLDRKDLNLYQESVAIRKAFPEGTSFRDMAKTLSKSPVWCRMRWRILDLLPETLKLVQRGVIKATDLPVLMYKSPSEQVALGNEMLAARERGESTRKYLLRKSVRTAAKMQREILAMLTKLMAEGIYPDPYKALMWAAGKLSDEELLESE